MFHEYFEEENIVILESGRKLHIQPADMKRNEPPKELTSLICECLEEELMRYGYKEPRELLGNCPTNATQLLQKLHVNGYEPELVIGGMSINGTTPDSIDEAFELQQVHHWVEVNGYVVEICSEHKSGPIQGQPYISERKPNMYVEFDRLTFQDWQEMGTPIFSKDNYSDYF